MADIDYLKPIKGEVAHPIFLEILAKADEGYGVVSGIRLHQTEPPSMSLASDSGIVKFAWMKLPDSGDTILFDASHSTLSRIDAVYWNNGLVIHKGDNQAIIDPKNNDNWKQYLSPVPKGGCPDGTILAMVFIEAGATAIYDEDIWMCAAPASDEPRHNNAAEAAPTIDDDQTVGYGEGSRWIDKTHLKAYRCLSAGDGAANWKQIWPPKVADLDGTIDHADLQNKGTNAHSVIDTFISSKAQASGLASLDENSKVVQDPANATATPAQGKIPIAGAGGLIASGWITGYHAHSNKTLLDAYDQANADLTDAVTKKHSQNKDLYLDFGGTNEISAANAKSAISLKHDQNKDTYLDFGGTNQVSAASLKALLTRVINLEFCIDGGGAVIATGHKPGGDVPVSGTIKSARVISTDGTSGSISITVNKATLDNTPGSMSQMGVYSISSNTKSVTTGLSIAVAAGDCFEINVTSCTSLKTVLLSFTMELS